VLWIFITFENPLLSARFDPANLGSIGKHDNHYITETDYINTSNDEAFETEHCSGHSCFMFRSPSSDLDVGTSYP
jgi:hypothetical protein